MSLPITIRSVEVRECRRPTGQRGRYTTGELDPAEDILFFVGISDGRQTGYGECVPTSLYYPPGHIGRSDIDEWAVLLEMARELPGRDARGLGCLVRDDFENDDANSIRDTLDFALHDLVGRCLGVPVGVLLGGLRRREVVAIPVIHTGTPAEMAAKAAGLYRKWGIRYFKLKPIGEREADIETLTLMRRETGPEVRYYMDANYGLKISDPDEIISYMDELHELGLVTYEDPVRADFDTLRYIRERTRVRIMIDELARTPAAILDILRARCADEINIHANWAGGFQPALAKARLAWLGGMPCMIGSTGYLGPGAAAYITLSSVLPAEGLCEETFSETWGRRSLVAEPYEMKDGRWVIPDRPGLGVEPDMEAVEAITARKEIIE